MNGILDAVLPVFALILIGYLAARRNLFGDAATASLNNFVVWMALPAVLFQSMAAIKPADIAHLGFIAAYTAGMALTFLVSFLSDRRPNHRLADRSIEGLDAAYPNTGFMGIPLGLAVFGTGILPALVLATIITACGLFAFSIVLIEIDLQGGHRVGRTVGKVGRAVIKNPLVFAPVLGGCFAATGLPLPGPMLRLTTLLGAAASPCALVTIGLFLAQSETSRERGTIARLVGLKLLFQPGVTAFLALKVFAMPPTWAQAAILLSALPTGTGPFMLAKVYEREAALTSRAILLSTAISIVTISLIVAWIGAG